MSEITSTHGSYGLFTHRPDLRGQIAYARKIAVILAGDRRAAAGVEFAIIVPVVLLLLFGMFDYGSLAYQTMQVSAAAHAGADYALHNGWSASAIQTAVTSATGLAISATPAPTQSTACASGTTLTVTTASTCPSGGTPGNYVTVYAQASFTPLAIWSSLTMPSTISAQAVIRIQ